MGCVILRSRGARLNACPRSLPFLRSALGGWLYRAGLLQPDQCIDVGHESLQIVRRDLAHELQATKDEVLGVQRTRIFRGTGECLGVLLFGAES